MSRAITSPPATQDAYSAQGDTVIGHTPEAAQAYREAAEEAARRQASGLPPQGSPVTSRPVVPSEAPLPAIGVARAVAGREIGRLKASAAAIERDLQRGCTGMGGTVTEYLVTRQREARASLEGILAEIVRLESLDDEQVRKFAFQHGAR